MKYIAVYKREADGRWSVTVPAVKGCHSYGTTIEQGRERIREALGCFVTDADTAEIVDKFPRALSKKAIAAGLKADPELRDALIDLFAKAIVREMASTPLPTLPAKARKKKRR